jgi:tetratricopeptide (TPR) repeat protein
MNIKLFASTLIAAASIVASGASTTAATEQPVPAPKAAAGATIEQAMRAARAAIDAGGAAKAWTVNDDDRADELYDEGREAIEEGRYERAIERFDRLIALKSNRTDAALYWKAYSLAKTGNRAVALQTLTDLQKQFADSRWIKDAKALEVEVKQASGQAVSPASQDDEELKLLALRGLMQSDPEQAFPVIEKILAGPNSPKVKDRALFVLSQSRSPRARDIIAGVAKGNGNPDLQLRAIKYIGIMGSQDSRQILADAYRTSNDPAVKRSIIQAMFVGGDSDKLIELAKTEKDPELRKSAIRTLGLMRRPGSAEALTSIYVSDAALDVRKAVVNALFLQNNGAVLVSLARNEKNAEMKKEIVSRLSIMKSKEATDYLLELLK